MMAETCRPARFLRADEFSEKKNIQFRSGKHSAIWKETRKVYEKLIYEKSMKIVYKGYTGFSVLERKQFESF